MNRARHLTFWSLGALALAALPGLAQQGRRITLRLEQASPEEAANRLSAVSGASINVDLGPAPGGPAPPRAGFNWSGVTLSQALRDLCRAYALTPTRRAGGFTLTPSGGGPEGPPPRRVGLFERSGVRLFARSLTWIGETRALNFDGGEGGDVEGSLNLLVGSELGERDSDSIAGMENVTGQDDAGGALRPSSENQELPPNPTALPDEWSSMLVFNAPRPQARKLLWVQGDLMAYRTFRTLKAEIPWTAALKGAHKTLGDWEFGVWDYQPRYRPAAPEGVFNGPVDPLDGPSIRADVTYPVASRIRSRGVGSEMFPVLLGASGRVYLAQIVNSTGGEDGVTAHYTSQYVFPGMKEADGTLVWEVVEKADPVKLFTFRLENIPLPVLKHAQQAAAPAPPVAAAPTHPFFQAGGGALSSQVLLRGQPAEGALRIGFSARSGAGWGPVRWMDVDVGPDGAARIDDLKPGEYRVTRAFRPKTGAPAPAGGAWRGAEATVVIAAGKEAALPPLRWEAVRKPAPARPGK